MKLDLKKIQGRIMKIGLETGCGHVASAMSCSRVLVQTYNENPKAIVILSKGHGALALYVILNELGKLPDKVLETYYKDGGLSGHATLNKKWGINASTGSLGHGLGMGIGYAIANPKKLVVVVMSDGECQEGSTLEAIALIKRLKIKNIMPVIDVNGFQGFDELNIDLLPRHMGSAYHFYSTKGEGFGEEFENTLKSHYTKVTPEIYDAWVKFINKEND